MTGTLEPFDDSSVARVLAIVAHPDDMEYGGSAAVALWRSRGVEVAYVLATSGEAGIDAVPPQDARPVREREQREACRLVGVESVTFLGFPDGTVEYGLPLRRALAAEVRRHRPDTVVTLSFRESWPGGALNQADHVAVGRAVVDAVRDAGNRWVFPELLDAGLQPWSGVRTLLALASPLAGHGIDVTDGFEAAVASLSAHDAYHRGLGPQAPAPRDVLESILGPAGKALGTRWGVSAEVLVP